MSSYWGTYFFEFFFLLFQRVFSLKILHPESDEIQMGLLALLSIGCGLLSPFLVLKKMTMFVNALSHTILLGIILSFLVASSLWSASLFDPSTLFLGAIGASFLTAFLTYFMMRWFRLGQETTVAILFSSLFALGVVFATLFTKHVHLGVESVMGHIDAATSLDLKMLFWIAFLIVGIISVFYRKLQISCFDPSFAKTIGIRPEKYHFLLLFLTSVISVFAFRAVGVVLVLAFLTGPYLIARLFSKKLQTILILSPMIAFFLAVVGVALSRHLLSAYDLALSTAGVVVTLMVTFYFAIHGWRSLKGKITSRNLSSSTPNTNYQK